MVAISIEYRLIDVHKTNLLAGVEDALSAIEWVRRNASVLGIDAERIAAAGFSAGGHLATLTALLNGEEGSSNSKPNALIAHSASYDLSKNKWFSSMTNHDPESVSSQHQVRPYEIPTILFHSKYDHLAPLKEFMSFVNEMESVGNEFDYHLFETGHFFSNKEAKDRVKQLTDEFLEASGFFVSSAD